MKRSPGRRWLIVVRIAGVGVVLAGCAETPVAGSDSAAAPCSVEGPPEEPGCLIFEEEPSEIVTAIVFLRSGDRAGTVEAGFFAESALFCPEAHGQSRVVYEDHDEAVDEECRRARQRGGEFVLYRGLMAGEAIEWTTWSNGSEGWVSYQAESPAGLRGLSARRTLRSRCVGVNQGDVQNVPIHEDSELTDGTVTLAELTPDGAVLDFDFDGARGRIASRVCTMNDGLW